MRPYERSMAAQRRWTVAGPLQRQVLSPTPPGAPTMGSVFGTRADNSWYGHCPSPVNDAWCSGWIRDAKSWSVRKRNVRSSSSRFSAASSRVSGVIAMRLAYNDFSVGVPASGSDGHRRVLRRRAPQLIGIAPVFLQIIRYVHRPSDLECAIGAIQFISKTFSYPEVGPPTSGCGHRCLIMMSLSRRTVFAF
jgi:hypothetical protein